MIYAFDRVTIDERCRLLFRGGVQVSVEPKVFDVLLYLIRNHDRVVGRDELLDVCWPNVHVADGTVSRCVCRLRQAIGQPRSASEPVLTLHGRGYRFVSAFSISDGTDAPCRPTTNKAAAAWSDGVLELDRRLLSPPDHAVAPCAQQSVNETGTAYGNAYRFLDIWNQEISHHGGKLPRQCGKGAAFLFGQRSSAGRTTQQQSLPNRK